jgi:hypothetical protein
VGRRVHTDTIIMVQTTECMISTIYVVVNINKYQIKLSLTNDVVAVTVGIGTGGVVVSGVIVGDSGALVTAVDVSTGPCCRQRHAVALPPPPQPPRCCHRAAPIAVCAAAVLCTAATAAAAAAAAALPLCCRRHHARPF